MKLGSVFCFVLKKTCPSANIVPPSQLKVLFIVINGSRDLSLQHNWCLIHWYSNVSRYRRKFYFSFGPTKFSPTCQNIHYLFQYSLNVSVFQYSLNVAISTTVLIHVRLHCCVKHFSSNTYLHLWLLNQPKNNGCKPACVSRNKWMHQTAKDHCLNSDSFVKSWTQGSWKPGVVKKHLTIRKGLPPYQVFLPKQANQTSSFSFSLYCLVNKHLWGKHLECSRKNKACFLP